MTVSLGNTARWRVRDEDGNLHSTVLVSGDVTLLEGPTRHLLHQVDHIDPEPDLLNPSPLDRPGRLAISLRSGAGREADHGP